MAAQCLILGVEGKLILSDPPLQSFIIDGYHKLTVLQGSIGKKERKAILRTSKVVCNKESGVIGVLRGELKKILRNEGSMTLLTNAQNDTGLKPTSPKLDVKTRWNSTYDMVSWALKNKKVIFFTLNFY